MAERVGVGIIGCGLMGRELAAAIGRWSALEGVPVQPELVAVCDVNPALLRWFDRVDSVALATTDHRELLADRRVDVVYVAVPHHLHERIYTDIIAAGKDFLGEKPFGIDLPAAARIVDALEAAPDVFARCSSEMPFFPGAQIAIEALQHDHLGDPIEVQAGLLHSSDYDPDKPINWKRQAQFCGEIGVMGDLGMHALHIPLRLGWLPTHVGADLQDIVPTRRDADGREVPCDTIDNATLHLRVATERSWFPLTIETKRIAPGNMNTWFLRAVGMDGAIEFSTRYPKTVRRLRRAGADQRWELLEVGSQSVVPTVTGGIFEFGFSDTILQMWAAFLLERHGTLGDRFGCATPREALTSHRIFAAALTASRERRSVPLP
jgi:predicted dehydrogenase